VVEASRKHGPFDTRWSWAHKDSAAAVPTAPPLLAAEAAEALDWKAFSHRYFPGRRRHNLEALTAYATYKQGREWRTTPARLSVVTTEPVSAAVELVESEVAGARRLLAAMAAEPDVTEEGPMPRERSELEQRRGELTRSLPGLSENRADTYRRNSDALALDRAGVKHERAEEMVWLGEAEGAANAAIRDVHRELRDIDAEIKLTPRPGLGARFGRTARRARAAR
jgi:hypothetical protein